MDQLISAAAGGMRSRMEALDLIANNLANASAPGFKADREFYNLYMSSDAEAGSGNLLTEPIIEKHWTDFSQGAFTSTGNPLDLSVAGQGFFTVESPSGTLYTRDGSFQLSSKGQIQTKDGYPLLGTDRKPIQVDSSKTLEIGRDGTVSQDGNQIATIAIMNFSNVHELNKQSRNYFFMADTKATPVPAGSEIEQGKLETANVQPAESAVKLVTVMRQFEMLQRAMSIGTDMSKRAIEDVARV